MLFSDVMIFTKVHGMHFARNESEDIFDKVRKDRSRVILTYVTMNPAII